MAQTGRHPSDLGASEHQDHKPAKPEAATGVSGTRSPKTRTDPASGEDTGAPKGSEKA